MSGMKHFLVGKDVESWREPTRHCTPWVVAQTWATMGGMKHFLVRSVTKMCMTSILFQHSGVIHTNDYRSRCTKLTQRSIDTLYLYDSINLRAHAGLASYPGVRGEGQRKRTSGTHCLRVRLIKSSFCDDDVFVWVGFCS